MSSEWLDIEAWPRREHYEFFRRYEQPFFNLCAEVRVGSSLRRCREPGAPSFFLASLHLSLAAVNEIDAFHYRLRDGGVIVHSVVHGGSTVLRPDGTFAFAYFDYDPDLETFARAGGEVLGNLERSSRRLEPRDDRDDLIHYSVIPWVAFTSFSHARRALPGDSTPRIVFGRYHGEAGDERMPVSVEVHHALMDGLHVARFLDAFQRRLDEFGRG